MGRILDAIQNLPGAALSPTNWFNGGKDPNNLQNPYYMSKQYNTGATPGTGVKRTSSAQDPSKIYGQQGTPTGATRTNTTKVTDANPWAGTPAAPGATGTGTATGGGSAATTPTSGTESGPGILENWFNQRATGTDLASQYATKRGMEALGNRYAAAGSYNSGAARQGEGDLLANIEAQRAGQLDALAGGASGEHQHRLDSMFGTGSSIAAGRSGINSAYDLSAAKAKSDALAAALGFGVNKAGVDSKSNQQGLSNLISLGALFG